MSARFSLIADPKRSRLVALGLLLAAVLAGIAVVGIPAWLLNRHYDTALADNLDRLERLRRIAATRPDVMRELQSMSSRDPHRFFLRGGTAALSAAEAQESIRGLVQSSGGRLITIGAPAARDEGHYRLVSINVQLTANIFALRTILGAIESNAPYLFVDNLVIRTQVPATFRPGPGGEPEMFVQFDVYGYSLGAAS